jgi:3-isopropylmalate/(R)-2-methylmalate dehydratase small subunit
MKSFKKVTSHIIPLWMNDIDTDIIIPAKYLTKVSSDGYGKCLFSELRNSRSFILNNRSPKEHKILCTGKNFGCGSSREHAVWAIQQYGIEVIVAPSFSDIFYSNAMKNGLLLIKLNTTHVEAICKLSEKGNPKACVDLEKKKITIDGKVYLFNYDPFRRKCLLNGYSDLDYLVSHELLISDYEKNNLKDYI